MNTPNTPIQNLERSYGEFPREHQFSAIDNLERREDNPELDVFLGAAQKLVTQWNGDQFVGLYLYGEPGTGKTHAAIGLARTLHDTGATIHYRHVPSWTPVERSVEGALGRTSVTTVEPRLTDWLGRAHFDSSTLPKPFPTSRPVSRYSPDYEDMHDKSVLILDDYKPFARNYVASAIEAASQYGGLVVITSNYTDPFKIIEETPDEKRMSAHMDAVTEMIPSASGIGKVMNNELAAKRNALGSRVAAAFKFIYFHGEDQRMETSFWND